MPFLPYIPFLSALPAPVGPHAPVGYATVTSPAQAPFSLDSPTINGSPALRLHEVRYAIYYPADRSGSAGWVPEPRAAVIAGYEKFLGKRAAGWMFTVIRAASGFVKFSAAPNALLKPAAAPYPLVIFSHGLAGTRTTYSQFCSSIAAKGYVVLAAEHRDGSGPSVLVSDEAGKKTSMQYTPPAELEWKTGTHSTDEFRSLQLDFRVREIYEAFSSLKQFVAGSDTHVVDGLAGTAGAALVDSFRGQVDFDRSHMAGHSFGGGTMLHLLQTPPPANAYAPLPIQSVLALDPWLEPLPLPAKSTDVSSSSPPVLVINAQGFTEWTSHFERLVKLVTNAKGSLCTVLGMGHQDFSDFPLLWPPKASTGQAMHQTVHELSAAFFSGRLGQSSAVAGRTADGGRFEREDGKMKGRPGEVVVHLLAKDTRE